MSHALSLSQLQAMKLASASRLQDAISAISEKIDPSPLLRELKKEFEIVLQVYKAEDEIRDAVPAKEKIPTVQNAKSTKKKPHWLSKLTKQYIHKP